MEIKTINFSYLYCHLSPFASTGYVEKVVKCKPHNSFAYDLVTSGTYCKTCGEPKLKLTFVRFQKSTLCFTVFVLLLTLYTLAQGIFVWP